MATTLPLIPTPPADALIDARSALADTGIAALADLFACLADDPATLHAETGRQALVEALICIVHAVAEDRQMQVYSALADCAPVVAAAARHLLLDALAAQGQTDAATFDHPTILSLAILSAAADCAMLSIADDA